MAQEEEKGFFDKLGDVLNAPLPGTQGTPAQQPRSATGDDDDDDGLLERIKDILNAPLPGTPQADSTDAAVPAEQQGSAAGAPAAQPGQAGSGAASPPREKTPEIDEDDLDEAWWKQDWSGFRGHQAQERNGLGLKQQRDLEKFAAYQEQEKQRFDAHQQQEFEAFVHMQGWRQAAWKQALANSPPGQKPPPPPWNMPPGSQAMPPGPMSGPGNAAPPWMRPPGRGRRRS